MAETTSPRFQPGAHVIYMGSLWQRRGSKYVSTVQLTNSGWVYSLTDPIWGGDLRNVRESSLLGPNDGPQNAAP